VVTTDPAQTPFHDLDAYIALPRLGGLALSPDGERLVTAVATIDAKRTTFTTALWEVDPRGRRDPRRLTRSAKGESRAAFLPDGSLLFVSARPDAETADGEDPKAALWLLERGGEARVVASRPGGIGGVVVAADRGTVVLSSPTMPSAVTAEDDEVRRTERKDRKVAAILHEQYPVRFWDHDLGPDQVRLFAGRVPAPPATVVVPAAKGSAKGDDAPSHEVVAQLQPGRVALRDLTPAPGRALDEVEFDVSPDGRTVATTWRVAERGGTRDAIALVDVETGALRLVLADEDLEYSGPRFSPDGRQLAVVVHGRTTATRPPDRWLAVHDVALGGLRVLTEAWDRWPGRARWTPDGRALLTVADDGGAAPVFRVEVADGAVTRLTGDHGAYSDVVVSPDGRAVYAIRAAVDAAPAPVRFDATSADQDPTYLTAPVTPSPLPGRLDVVTAAAEDGTPVRAWICLPHNASAADPAPLLLWIHGGPLGSWNAWSWRWNPWLAVAQGYAVLLPDPALSTGYGLEMIRRGWGRWGGEPYTDLMAVTDAAEARPDVDETRTAAMGGSFGGYMANWVAGHTDRFAGIVTHASLWALDQFGATTDAADYWRREMTAEMALANSPHRFVDEIRTPMLVVHGDKDYRVPIGEGLRLWTDLAQRAAADGTMPHKFLYFPDENHWVLQPQHAKVWYQAVFAFLEHTVHGKEWVVPEILR
jgi:dipeptidyl aminopeptidase/acylaminoacyl peptidase